MSPAAAISQSLNRSISPEIAAGLLRGLVAVPSLSCQEAAASAWLVEQMRDLGYTRAYVDGAGNAVGEMGAEDAQHTIVLLGHIDTVPGNIPVRVEDTADGPLLYGRGSVDAKGPLAAFVAAVARLGAAWAVEHNLRLVVVGAVEEEYATSKGARFICRRFNGGSEPIPSACIIGEPSSWQRVTLGYKGRLLIELAARQPMAHTAGPDAGVATVAVDLWNWIGEHAAMFNVGKDKAFEQLAPSLRSVNTWTDEEMVECVTATIGLRLPIGFDPGQFTRDLAAWAERRAAAAPSVVRGPSSMFSEIACNGPRTSLTLRCHALELPWRSDRNNFLVRSFLAAIRTIGPTVRPGFVLKTGTSDMNVAGPSWGCPILAYGPGDSALDHTPNEHIRLDEYWQAVLVLEQALRNLPQSINEPVPGAEPQAPGT
jgi:LysW-gamma-L-lysine carboxypeptidase